MGDPGRLSSLDNVCKTALGWPGSPLACGPSRQSCQEGCTVVNEPILPMSDGVITVRPLASGDQAVLVAGRDGESRRWLGEGSDDPTPTGCIVAGGQVVGWVDYDTDRDWLRSDQVNVGLPSVPRAPRPRGRLPERFGYWSSIWRLAWLPRGDVANRRAQRGVASGC